MLRTIGFALLGYLIIIVLGLIPVNNDFEQANDGVSIYVFSGPVHSDVILPTVTDAIDWRDHFPPDDFRSPVVRAAHVAIGWGDRGFFLETPRWKDLKVSTAAKAMFLPSKTVMHVQFYAQPKETNECKKVVISNEAYERLVAHILTSFAQNDSNESADNKILIDPSYAYGRTDAFYEAKGSYHLFNTCNCWVAGTLKAGGVRTPWFSPLPRTVLLYLPD